MKAFVYILTVVLLTVACSRDVKNSSSQQNPVTTKNIKSLSMNCQGSTMSCSGSVGGFLVFDGDKLETFCTAFVLTESLNHSIIATSSHCLKPIHRNLQEEVPQTLNKDYVFAKYDIASQNNIKFYDINEVLVSQHSHGEHLGLDYAYLSTFERVNVPEQKIHHNSIERSELPLLITTASIDTDSLLISIKDHNNCSSVADRGNLLNSLFHTPENFGIEYCKFIPGNSGAPVYFNNTLAGILNSGETNKLTDAESLNEIPEAQKAYANNILCTEPLKIKKASRNSERPLFSQKWFCSSSFKLSSEFKYLIKKIDRLDTHYESHFDTLE